MKPAKKTELYIKIFSLAVFAVLLIAASEDFYRFRVCFGAGKRIPSFTDAVPVRFLLYGSSGDTVSAAFYLFDSAHKELAAVERSWKGDSLAVEFAGAQFGGKTVYFPLCIYASGSGVPSHKSYRSGTPLSRYYMRRQTCLLYNYTGYEKDFYRFARYALRPFFGLSQRLSGAPHSKHVYLSLSACTPGKMYVIKTDSQGGLEVRAE